MRLLIAFLADQTLLERPVPPDSFRLAFLKACVGEPPGVMAAPSLDADVPISAPLLTLCAQSLPLTPGAVRLLLESDRLFRALQVILNDRSFRKELRAFGQLQGKSPTASRLLALVPELDVQRRAARTRVVLPKLGALPAPKTAAARVSTHDEPSFVSTLVPPLLARFAALPVSTSARSGEGTMRIGELIAGLADPQLPLSRLVTAMRSLAGSGNRVALVLAQRAVARGEIQVRADAMFYLLAETARALVTLNANASAYGISSALIERYCQSGRGVLPQEDMLRLLGLHARICVRTGRVGDAERLFKRLHLTQPAEANFALEYFLSIFTAKPEEAAHVGRGILTGGLELDYSANLALAEFFIQHDSWAEASGFLIRAARVANGRYQHLLTSANIALRQGDDALWCELLGEFGHRAGMGLAAHDPRAPNRVFSFQGAGQPEAHCAEMVSVMMTAFNSAETIEAAMDSVLAQRGMDVELIVIDDGSTDGTRDILAARAAVEPRLRVVMNTRNMGTYASKNHGITMSRGSLLAFHDSDDWMHPMHLYRQAENLLGGHVCTTSQWLRMRADGYVIQRRGGGYAHLNPASTLFRRNVVEEMGPFDFVRTGADAEYLTRIRLRYGWSSVLQMEDCLALGLHHEGSLTQSGATAFDEHRFSPVRLAYTEAWVTHHLAQLEQQKEVALHTERERPFEVPAEIRS